MELTRNMCLKITLQKLQRRLLGAILQRIPQPPIIKISLKITYLKFLSNLPGANELSKI